MCPMGKRARDRLFPEAANVCHMVLRFGMLFYNAPHPRQPSVTVIPPAPRERGGVLRVSVGPGSFVRVLLCRLERGEGRVSQALSDLGWSKEGVSGLDSRDGLSDFRQPPKSAHWTCLPVRARM